MSRSWFAFALIQPHWVMPVDIPLPYRFSDQVSLRAVPHCAQVPDVVDGLREQLSERIAADGSHHCITVEYQANENESPPSQGPGPVQNWSAHDVAEQQARLAHLVLWLIRPTALTFTTIVLAEKRDPEWITRAINSYSPTYALSQNTRNKFSSEDLVVASKTIEALNSISFQGPIRTAVLVATRVLCDETLEFRLLIIWLAMECLFGPEDGREITFRLAQRVALFLESDRAKAIEVFKMVKDCYGLRSKLVHGFRAANIKDEKFMKFSLNSETLLRRSLLTILDTAITIQNFDGPTREAYLEGLVFK